MQDPMAFQTIKPQFPEQEQLKCPRCDSTNTKFCYYNNYNLSQPRHFCKNCRRYWTKGGALRNIPVGGGSRKNTKRSSTSSKRPASSSSSPTPSSVSTAALAPAQAPSSVPEPDATRAYPSLVDQGNQRVVNIGGSFSSLLASTGHLGSLLEGLNSSGSNLKMLQMNEFGVNAASSDPAPSSDPGRIPGLNIKSNGNSESFLSMQNGESTCWNGSSGWSNHAIYTRGPSIQ